MLSTERDDFFTVIHKALRAGLLRLDIEAGRMDWGDFSQVAAFSRAWEQVITLVRSHAGHEERFVWPLLESKQPGSVAELGVGHDPIEAELEAVDALLKGVLAAPTPEEGLTFYRAVNRLVMHALDHFANEEPAVMDLLWATCTDGELAGVRAALMAEIPSDEAAWTFELIMQSSTPDEQRPVLQGLRASMPPPVFADWLTGVERRLPAEALARLRLVLAEGVPAR